MLPNHYTQRKVYEKWIYSCGWVAKATGGDSSYGKTSDYKEREFDDLYPEGTVRFNHLVSKSTFISYMKKKHSDIMINSICKDTCRTCYSFKNDLKKIK